MLLDRMNPKVLVVAALCAGLAFQLLLGTSYIAAHLDPLAESDGLPVAVVNLDRGDHGATFAKALAAQDGPVKWEPVTTREAALRGLEQKHYFGALVIPANFSDALASILTTTPRAAVVEAIGNPGASTSGNLVATRAMEVAVERLRAEVQERALRAASPTNGIPAPGPSPVPSPVTAPGGGGVLTLDQARVVANPVHLQTSTVNPVPPSGANGLAPVYLAMAAWVGGYMGAIALERFQERLKLTPARRALVIAGGAAAQALIATAVLAMVGFTAPDALMLAALLALGTWMAYSLVTLLLDLFGLPGVVPAFAILALGIPASGAVYPVEMLPSFYQALHGLAPFTWLVEGLRTVLYAPTATDLQGNMLMLALVAIGATAGSLALQAVKARNATRKA